MSRLSLLLKSLPTPEGTRLPPMRSKSTAYARNAALKTRPAEMQNLKQRTKKDCGVACMAMLADISYDSAWQAALPVMADEAGTIPFERLAPLFEGFGFQTSISEGGPDASSPSGLCEISYARDGKTVWHYVVWDAGTGRFIDPQKKPPAHFLVIRFLALSRSAC